ncbi:MAG TPA: hypothetical protein EYN95_04035 [Methylococcaceae bacterium]|nr:hypothetical protein [Methylococcaceae bacterium]
MMDDVIEVCPLSFICEQTWDDLAEIDKDGIRRCGECNTDVYSNAMVKINFLFGARISNKKPPLGGLWSLRSGAYEKTISLV